MPQPTTIWCCLANGQHKSHMKKCLEFENNVVGCTTFVGWPTCRPGISYMYN